MAAGSSSPTEGYITGEPVNGRQKEEHEKKQTTTTTAKKNHLLASLESCDSRLSLTSSSGNIYSTCQ